MNSIGKRLMLSAALVAAAVSFTSTSGLPGAVGVAAAAPPLAHQAPIATEANAVILAKDLKCCGKGGDGGIPPGPGDFKGGGGGDGKGGKGGKGGHHHHNWGPGVAGAVILGLAHCAIQTERCEETYGADTERYWRCMRRSGC